ncbi:MAG: PD40 domain-containing protein [Gemmatimonadota bacterium]|nr:MAG: PD40 domain-containing protein [Gemmatimonadota bacterium]
MLFRRVSVLIAVMLCGISLALPVIAEEGRLLRFPDAFGDNIVFVYGGDLWTVPTEGGIARKLTTHPGYEMFPKYSPDGQTVAFTGQYDGHYNVFTVPADGGVPQQLTFEPDPIKVSERMGPNNQVIDWYPDGKAILCLSRRTTFNDWFGQLFKIDAGGGLSEKLPLLKGGLTSFSPDGKRIAYNRIFRNFRTWKRYKGGMAQDIWLYDFGENTIKQMTDYEGTDTSPMWHDNTIYFTSDRGGNSRLNIYAFDLTSETTRQITDFDDFDVLWPSLGTDHIVFEKGGSLYLLDLNTEQVRKVSVALPGDRIHAQPRWVDGSKFVTEYSLSTGGKRALLVARGDVFTLPAEKGTTRNLTRTPGVREKYATWSPDGKWIACVSDKTGEDEIYMIPHDGKGEAVRITTDGHCFRFHPVWSPDNTKLLFADKNLKLYYADIESRKVSLIDSTLYWEIRDYDWSPDSKWVTYAKPAENVYYSIYLYNLEDRRSYRVTSDFTDDRDPVFDPDGKYLYFLSDRNFNAVLGDVDFSFTVSKSTGIYVVTLQADTLSPFAPESDEAVIKDDKGEEKEKAEKVKEKAVPFKIDIEGIQDRVVGVPVDRGNLGELRAAKGKILYVARPTGGLSGTEPGEEPTLHVYDLKKRKDDVVLSPCDGYSLSPDGEKIIYKSGETYGIIEAKAGEVKVGDGSLSLSDMKIKVDYAEEWRQMFDEAWRYQRDYFYDPNMHGLDWIAIREKYAALVPHLAHRFDLTFLIGEVFGELSNSHTYVGGGEMPEFDKVSYGYLGVDFELDVDSGRYRIKKIYPGENWRSGYRSPLTEPGVDVKEGEYLLAVNGRPLRGPTSPYSLFENTVDKSVTLTVHTKPEESGSREVTVTPIGSEFNLRYLDMVNTNLRKVSEATDGRVGYMYLPDMGTDGMNEFIRQYYPQVRKQGLIIDVRYNGGGFIDQMLLERLRRVVLGMSSSRNAGDWTYPEVVFHGHMACVTNEYAASDGDYFTYFFKKNDLGPVIGKRTWGGVRGYRGPNLLLDGGYAIASEFSLFSTESKWLMENHGAVPTVEVDNRPDLVVQGRDPQLEKAIELVLEAIREDPKKLPERPPHWPPYPGGE